VHDYDMKNALFEIRRVVSSVRQDIKEACSDLANIEYDMREIWELTVLSNKLNATITVLNDVGKRLEV